MRFVLFQISSGVVGVVSLLLTFIFIELSEGVSPHEPGLGVSRRVPGDLFCFALLVGFDPTTTGATQTPGESKAFAKIYFVPFAVKTFAPITMEEIKGKGIHAIWFTKGHPFISKLEKTLESKATEKKINNRVIRLKVAFGKEGNVFYVDQEGIVLKNDQKSFQISKKQREEIERDILYFSGVVDVKESKSLGAN